MQVTDVAAAGIAGGIVLRGGGNLHFARTEIPVADAIVPLGARLLNDLTTPPGSGSHLPAPLTAVPSRLLI